MPETFSTITVHVADRFVPSCVEAIIVAKPTPFAVIKPSELTVATPELAEDQLIDLLEATLGKI